MKNITRMERSPLRMLYNKMRREMTALGAGKSGLGACLVPGVNVLDHGRDTPGPESVESLNAVLDGQGIVSAAPELGRTQRRSCSPYFGKAR